jgi:DNA-binding NarL/FixJ family response regulator
VSAAAPRVLLADHVPATRLGVRIALQSAGMRVVAEAADAPAAITAGRACAADVCLVDIELPGGGVAAVAGLVVACPRSRVIALGGSRPDEDPLAALRAGAAGYLPKEIEPGPLVRAVRGALGGEAPLPRTLTARLVEELQMRSGERRVRGAHGSSVVLPQREAVVLELLRRGLSTREIARRLGISPVTVRRHISETTRRLGVDDREAAVRLVGAGHA